MEVNLLTRCQMMLMQARQQNNLPLVFIMNSETHQVLTSICSEHARVKQSKLKNWYFKWRKKHLILLQVFGVPIADNNYLPNGMVSLQALPSSVAAQMQAQAQPVQQAQVGGNPFQQGLRIEEAPAADTGTPTLDELAYGSGKPSVSDVLIKAIDGADKLKHVAVLRVYHNNDVDASTTMEMMELSGAIQKFHIWCMQQGG